MATGVKDIKLQEWELVHPMQIIIKNDRISNKSCMAKGLFHSITDKRKKLICLFAITNVLKQQR